MKTIGERIAQLRKENGLSQELFGEALGVSRQAISKWESNQSVPEVEKLLAMHRLYDVSIGWLLGTEEERISPDELTEAQLKMVDQIVQKYIEAIPRPEPTSRAIPKIWKLCALIFGAAFLLNSINMYSRFNNLDNQQRNLEYSIDRIQSSVDSKVQSIGNRVEEIISKQNSILAEYSAEYTSVNLTTGKMYLALSATPKTYIPGMKLEFIIDDGIESITVRGEERENRSYTALAECTLTDAVDISVVIYSKGIEQTQLIESWMYLFSETKSSVDIMQWEMELWSAQIDDYMNYSAIPLNTFTKPQELLLFDEIGEHPTVSVSQVEHLVYVNGTKNQHLYASPGVSEFRINGMDSREYVATQGYKSFCAFLNVEFMEELNIGDTLDIITVVTDNFGRRYVSSGCAFCVDEERRFSYANLDFSRYVIDDVIDSLVKY